LSASIQHRDDIDGLRAVAVLLVVLFHIGVPGITGGYVGVDVFFVISGYLITSLLLVEAENNKRISLTDFYARRIRRLFPALMLVVLTTLILGLFWLLPVFQEQGELAKSAVATSVYLSNVYFWLYTGNYFDGPAELQPLLHTWSLAVEEQFYLFWPFLLIGILWIRRHNTATLRNDLLKLVLFIFAVSLVVSVWTTESNPRAAYYLMPARAWEFAVGGVLPLILPATRDRFPRMGGLLSAGGLIAIIGSALWLTEKSAFPGTNALWPTLGAAAVLAGGALNAKSVAVRLLTMKPMLVMGLLSYSWYLWHWPLLAIPRANSIQGHDLIRDGLLGGVVAFIAAAITYRFIENPVRVHRPGPFSRTWPTLWTGAAISIFLAASAVALSVSAKYRAENNPTYAAITGYKLDTPPLRPNCHHDEPYHGLSDANKCIAGDRTKIRAVLWGDSHADHLSPLMQAFAEDGAHGGILQRSFSSCRPVDAPALMIQTKDCLHFNEDVSKEIDALEKQGLRGVVLSTMWSSMFKDKNPNPPPEIRKLTDAQRNDQIISAIDGLVTELVAQNLRVLLVAPTYLLPSPTPQCLARHPVTDCSVTREHVDVFRKISLSALQQIVAKHPGTVRLWDPIDFLCDTEICLAKRGDTAMFTDDLHLSASGARLIAPGARDSLVWLTEGAGDGYAQASEAAAE
jgi:peptidoglycan/LPS O-acetylase OafA/YrhL